MSGPLDIPFSLAIPATFSGKMVVFFTEWGLRAGAENHGFRAVLHMERFICDNRTIMGITMRIDRTCTVSKFFLN